MVDVLSAQLSWTQAQSNLINAEPGRKDGNSRIQKGHQRISQEPTSIKKNPLRNSLLETQRDFFI